MKQVSALVTVLICLRFGYGDNLGNHSYSKPLPIDMHYKDNGGCLMEVTGNDKTYWMIPTTEKKNGRTVYQGYTGDNCLSISRYIKYRTNESPRDKYKLDVALDGYNGLGYVESDICTTSSQVKIARYDHGYDDGVVINKVDSSRCFPQQTEALPLDFSNDCVMAMTLRETYTFLPTTVKRNGRTVFQAFDDSCRALDRYLHHSHNPHRYPEWNFDRDLNPLTLNLGHLPHFRTCVDTSDYVLVHILGMRYDQTIGHVTKIASSPCLPNKATALPLDRSSDCLFSLSGYENYTFLPTTEVRAGSIVFQGFDNTTCTPLNRYIYRRTYGDGHFEWNIDTDLQHAGYRLGYLNPDFVGCTSGADVIYQIEFKPNNYARLNRIQSSPCFTKDV
eukprot:Lankesteria_metandrocarpae@DN5444_c0_g2_i1.p1